MTNGLVTVASADGPESTLARLLSAIKGRGITVVSIVDHAAAALAANLVLAPSALVIFGDARAGTPLMQGAPTLAIDLPLKVLVWTDGSGETWLSYNDPVWLAARHCSDPRDAPVLSWGSEGGAEDRAGGTCSASSCGQDRDAAATLIMQGMARTLAAISREASRSVDRGDVVRIHRTGQAQTVDHQATPSSTASPQNATADQIQAPALNAASSAKSAPPAF